MEQAASIVGKQGFLEVEGTAPKPPVTGMRRTTSSLLLQQQTRSLLTILTELAEARQVSIGEPTLLVYVRELRQDGVDERDIKAAVRKMMREPRGEYESAFPTLATVLARVEEARRDRTQLLRWKSCGACNEVGMITVNIARQPCERGDPDYWGMSLCQCKRSWLAARDAAEQSEMRGER